MKVNKRSFTGNSEINSYDKRWQFTYKFKTIATIFEAGMYVYVEQKSSEKKNFEYIRNLRLNKWRFRNYFTFKKRCSLEVSLLILMFWIKISKSFF